MVVPDDLIDLAREADRAKAPKGKLGRQLEKPVRRARNYSYRGVGRDDGECLTQYCKDWLSQYHINL